VQRSGKDETNFLLLAVQWERVSSSLNGVLDQLLQYVREERLAAADPAAGLTLPPASDANPIQNQFQRLKQATTL
jgi:hypothetical protein